MILSVSSAFAGGPAGILLYCRQGDNVFLLLANDSRGRRGWSGFGGSAERGESERETAARETEEETRGYFSRAQLLQQIAKQEPVQSGGFSMYFAEVPFVPAQRVMNHPLAEDRPELKEAEFYAWIPFSEIEPILTKGKLSDADLKMNPLYVPRGCRAHSFWRVWMQNMCDAQKQKPFPWTRKPKPGTEGAVPAEAEPRP